MHRYTKYNFKLTGPTRPVALFDTKVVGSNATLRHYILSSSSRWGSHLHHPPHRRWWGSCRCPSSPSFPLSSSPRRFALPRLVDVDPPFLLAVYSPLLLFWLCRCSSSHRPSSSSFPCSLCCFPFLLVLSPFSTLLLLISAPTHCLVYRIRRRWVVFAAIGS